MTDEMGTPWNGEGDASAPPPAPAGPFPEVEVGPDPKPDPPQPPPPAPAGPFPEVGPGPAAYPPPPPPPPAPAGPPGPDTYAGYQQPTAPWSPPASTPSPSWPGAPSGPSWTAGPSASPDPWPAPHDLAAAGEVPQSGKRRRPLLLAAVGIALVCAAGGGGAAIALSVDHSSSTTGPNASSTFPPATGGGPVNVSAIASCIDPAVVDLHTDGGAGTGMVLTPGGVVLTNNHVVSGATQISGQIDGAGKTYKVDVLGVDPTDDVALVRLEGASNLPVVRLGSSSNLVIGEQVVAIGNALNLAGPPTVTSGIISALDRSITASDPGTDSSENLSGLIQTQASINPGNSGGPLVNGRCRVIGMNTAAANGSTTQSASDIGFAIPIDTAAGIVRQVENRQASTKVVLGERAYIGVAVFSVAEAESPEGLTGPTGGYTSPVKNGAVVANVVAGLPAEGAGVQAGDVIVSFNGSTVASPADLERLIGLTHPYAAVKLGWVDLGGVHHSATVTLALVPVK